MIRRAFCGFLFITLTCSSPGLADSPETGSAAAAESADRQAVLEVLESYEEAMEAKDLEALKELWPRLSEVKAEARTISMSFDLTRSLDLDLEVSNVEIGGDEATVECVRRDEITLTNGEIFENESFVRFRLRRADGAWRITSLEDFEGEEMR